MGAGSRSPALCESRDGEGCVPDSQNRPVPGLVSALWTHHCSVWREPGQRIEGTKAVDRAGGRAQGGTWRFTARHVRRGCDDGGALGEVHRGWKSTAGARTAQQSAAVRRSHGVDVREWSCDLRVRARLTAKPAAVDGKRQRWRKWRMAPGGAIRRSRRAAGRVSCGDGDARAGRRPPRRRRRAGQSAWPSYPRRASSRHPRRRGR